jgi:hypothetical protein
VEEFVPTFEGDASRHCRRKTILLVEDEGNDVLGKSTKTSPSRGCLSSSTRSMRSGLRSWGLLLHEMHGVRVSVNGSGLSEAGTSRTTAGMPELLTLAA